MNESGRTFRIFISAVEPSADVHCANLITALKQRNKNIEFVGVGGFRMAGAGCELLEDPTGQAAMIQNAFGKVFHFYGLIRRIRSYFVSHKIDLVIVCDSPAFNFHIAKAAKKANIKTLFYVAPQLWAWAAWRIRKLRRCCDKLCCILPFEQSWFGQKGLDVTFVGNPLLDEIEGDISSYKKSYSDYETKQAKIAIMPGSRSAEIESLWIPMQQVAVGLKRKFANLHFTTVAVDEGRQRELQETQVEDFKCEYTISSVAETSRKVDFAIVTSGSATLQVAAAGCPMVIMYQSSRFLWHLIGRWILTTKYLSLVNILAEKELVPEFMPYFASIEPIEQRIEELLCDRDKLVEVSSELIDLTKSLKAGSASENAAKIVCEMLS